MLDAVGAEAARESPLDEWSPLESACEPVNIDAEQCRYVPFPPPRTLMPAWAEEAEAHRT
jgi:hypothetical protein